MSLCRVVAFFSLLGCFADLPLFYWKEGNFVNFGDHLSLKLVERIVGDRLRFYNKGKVWPERKLLAIGSILSFAQEGDIVWGSGINGKLLNPATYAFKQLDVRAVRGPLTRHYLEQNFDIHCPETYGDPALLFPFFFPEFKKKAEPSCDYILIVHYLERGLFPKNAPHIVYATDPWEEVVDKILDSRFVVSTCLHGLIIAESYGIPARLLRVTEKEPLFKYQDYYAGTQRATFKSASSVEEALSLGGEPLPQCDLIKLYEAFPFEYWD